MEAVFLADSAIYGKVELQALIMESAAAAAIWAPALQHRSVRLPIRAIQAPRRLLYQSPVTTEQWKWLQEAPAARHSLGFDHSPADHQQDRPFTRLDSVAAAQLALPKKTPQLSRVSVTFPFSTDERLRQEYEDHKEEVSVGRLLMDIDCLGGFVCRKHCLDGDISRPLMFVTALIDKLVLFKPMPINQDLKLVGELLRGGPTSLTVRVQATHEGDDEAAAFSAVITFSARDRVTGKKARVNGLIIPNSDFTDHSSSSSSFQAAFAARVQLLLEEGQRLLSNNVSDHATQMQADLILISSTCLESVFLTQPQNMNSQGSVFGGFLMSRACDLAFCTAYEFAGCDKPVLLQMYRTKFLQSVKVGSLVRVKAFVLHTEEDEEGRQLIHLEVEIVAESKPAILLYSTFASPTSSILRRVLPSTQGEAIKVVDLLTCRKQLRFL